jgi:hypothetical protein
MAYTPPAPNAINFTLQTYTAPAVNDIDFELAASMPVFDITVNQTMPTPAQAATAQTAMPVAVAQTMPTPSQTITAETAPGTAKKPLGAGGPRGAWEYRPPLFAIRTKGRQEAPPPGEKIKIRTRQVATGMQIAPVPEQRVRLKYIKKVAFCSGNTFGLTPSQSGNVWPHRLKHVREEEERKVILMLLGFDLDEYERQMNQTEAATATD